MPRQVGNAGRVVVGAVAIKAWLDHNMEAKRPAMARLAAALDKRARPAAMARLAAVLKQRASCVVLCFVGFRWKEERRLRVGSNV